MRKKKSALEDPTSSCLILSSASLYILQGKYGHESENESKRTNEKAYLHCLKLFECSEAVFCTERIRNLSSPQTVFSRQTGEVCLDVRCLQCCHKSVSVCVGICQLPAVLLSPVTCVDLINMVSRPGHDVVSDANTPTLDRWG
ncbi:hypothetical protein Q8A67_002306 [Cirrhinus molitorella]|uniref:Uncharacterized protein n=1 Tax=Cirrhinus molitorella TaxID=172907 RepID=A0AA88QAR3_9TELE|nr:hypothetical protein Q8A67_002306 [Cirrhinus molitorella]